MTWHARFLDASELELNELVDFPSAAPLHAGVRKRLLTNFPYALLYSLREDEIRILAVSHQRRRPFYWQGRE